ncbi:hypothetical protein [Rhodococcoides kyotonense]|uniref:hypothetical protein n=1 Tax=Rhodococcoides kyotonense TaxID=398843 RepID=UPI0012EDDFE5|nr:hypothetical protein [Rhodococcus kyotonensis]
MTDIGVLRIGKRLISRRWRRVISAAVIAVFVLHPEMGRQATLWAGGQYAQRLSRMVDDAGLLDFGTMPPQTPLPDDA